MEFDLLLVGATFIAGLLMFLAPCTLPLLPAFLAFISGTNERDLLQLPNIQRRRRLVKNTLFFSLGFSVIFISFGIAVGWLGSKLGDYRLLFTKLGGVMVILFGLFMLGALKFKPLRREYTFPMPKRLQPGQPLSAFLIGGTFALGWTPCIGPVLATVLLVAATTNTAFYGGFLLTIFSIGLAIPFMVTALLYAEVQPLFERSKYLGKAVYLVGGAFLIFIGLLLLTDNFGLMVEYGYQLFDWFGFEALFDYL